MPKLFIQNSIPVFCPALTDGSLGDILYNHTFRQASQNGHLRLDIVEDVRRINLQAVYARSTGLIVLGGGLIKHHTFNANLMRNGADYCVLVNTGSEFDGSDSGARLDEAESWGKLRSLSGSDRGAESVDQKKYQPSHVKIHADASLVFPLLVAQTFAKMCCSVKK